MKIPDEIKLNGDLEKTQKSWITRKYHSIVQIMKSLLTQGISPQKIALAIAIGFVAGTFPLIGTHTPIGIALAYILRLNQVAVYIGAWLSLPVFFLLLLPALRAGEYLLKAPPMELDTFVENLKRMTHSYNDFIDVWSQYGHSILHILIGWVPLIIIIALLVYFITLYVAKIIASRKNIARPD